VTLRTIEVFTAGCALCEETVQVVRNLACPSCRVDVLDMKGESARKEAQQYGVMRVPAVVVNGTLADCCQLEPINIDSLRALGVGNAK
jgi:alkyl hydroperoxide reductase subunit AhpF